MNMPIQISKLEVVEKEEKGKDDRRIMAWEEGEGMDIIKNVFNNEAV